MSAARDKQRGSWYFVVKVPDPAGGKARWHKERGFPTKREALAAERRHLHERRSGTPHVEASRLTVATFLTAHWLPALAGRELRPTTVDAYQRAVRIWIVPTLGAAKLQQLDAAAVERMLAVMAEAGKSPKYRRNVVGVLSVALADAKRWGHVSRNVASGVRLPRLEKPPPRAWTVDQVGAFLAHVTGTRLEPLWVFIVMTGVRRGEALGLRWRDVDARAGTVTIVNQRAIAGGRVVEGPPKTASGARTVALDPETMALLQLWRKHQRAEYVALGVRPAHDLVFTGEDGVGLWPQRVTAAFRAIAQELGFPSIGPHGLRHSAATEMLASGESPKVVATRLGHANPSITMAIYAAVMPGHDQAAAARLASTFRRGLNDATQNDTLGR